jgi:hypothetical protein
MTCLFAVAAHPRKIRKQSELESRIQWTKKIVLMTWQNIAWLQAFERVWQACPRIWQSHTQNCKIDRLMWWQLRRCSARIDINALATNFDEKC